MRSIIVSLALLLVVVGGAPAQAAVDVGLISQIAGEVTYQPAGGVATRAANFIKVRDGDRFSAAPGASVRVIYFDTGRQESWAGPATFMVGLRESVASSVRPAVSQLPTAASQKLSLTPELIQVAKSGRTGSVVVRSPSPKAVDGQAHALREARATYAAMQPAFAPDDITPEMYLATVLHEHKLIEEMQELVVLMQKKQPHNAEVKALSTWLGTARN